VVFGEEKMNAGYWRVILIAWIVFTPMIQMLMHFSAILITGWAIVTIFLILALDNSIIRATLEDVAKGKLKVAIERAPPNLECDVCGFRPHLTYIESDKWVCDECLKREVLP